MATVVFAFSSGMLEVLLSPIIDAIPGGDKGPAMSLMHSFYAWGQVITIHPDDAVRVCRGQGELANHHAFMGGGAADLLFHVPARAFSAGDAARGAAGMRQLLFHPFYLLALGAIFCGAGTEIVLNQWSSTFMEKALELPKVAGDLLGMCGFAAMLGLARLLYGLYGSKIDISGC